MFLETLPARLIVALTMRRLAQLGAQTPLTVVTCGRHEPQKRLVSFSPDWSVPLPAANGTIMVTGRDGQACT